MRGRIRALCAPLLLVVLLAACSSPGGGGGDTASTATSGRPAQSASPTLPGGTKPPRPVPDPAAVAAGAPLRATLLAQIDEYDREVARCNSVGTPVISCNVTASIAIQPHTPELAAYMGWYSFIKQCSADGKGGYIATLMYIYSSPAELREPGLLDVYVSGTPWCGQARPAATPQTTPRPGG